ncbi:pyrroline-5-carboxylate reductase [Burkholderiaceae bacterium FT117]|uniref:pyrroline-5-carboxylate reductase n=1 Tax=Zeimonas sediminis TaxID=2944268 RepID=UPI002342D47D|nr:pyrroline-5-carboxylate reductase [Zeimonas sediminis]MCM5570011.1 pyrroline-5-carboxylate reductase [Zeimonas sediminis]
MKMLFVGGGNMAAALIGGLIARGTAAADILVVDPSEAQRDSLGARFGVTGLAAIDAEAVASAGLIVLAVKPQQMREAAAALAPAIGGQLVVSVAAGIRAADLSRWLGGHRRIVRAMPNTPALIGLGVTGLAAPSELASGDRSLAERVLGAVGTTVWVDDESKLDAVTAISGSGPAYVFLFIEALEAAAERLGLSPTQARALAQGTVSGAAQLAAQSTEPPATLRERVTSKGGTTAAALAELEAADLRGLIAHATQAAQRRSVELGDEFGRD